MPGSSGTASQSENSLHAPKFTWLRLASIARIVAGTLIELTAQSVTSGKFSFPSELLFAVTSDRQRESLGRAAQMRVVEGVDNFIGLPEPLECRQFPREPRCAQRIAIIPA